MEETQSNAAALDAWIWPERHALIYRCELSGTYHRAREAVLDGIDRAGKFTAIVAGSATLSRVGSDGLVLYLAGAVVILSGFSLVWGLSERARRHSALAERFRKLRGLIERAGVDLTAEQVADFQAMLSDIESTEPMTFRALVLWIQNQMALAAGQPDRVTPMQRHRQWLRHVLP